MQHKLVTDESVTQGWKNPLVALLWQVIKTAGLVKILTFSNVDTVERQWLEPVASFTWAG